MKEKERFIVHVDMDAFFAACEQRDDPSLKGKPVVIGADPKEGKGRGVVSTCSYEARKFNISSGMPISTAYKRCPGAVFLPPNMRKYAEVSHEVFNILEGFTPDIEPVSIDEAFMDISGSWHLFGTPVATCKKIKAAIRDRTGLTASAGLAPNKMTAKIASDMEKPDGLVVVTRKGLLDFLRPLPVGKLWGVGEKTLKEFASIGIHTIGDLAQRSEEDLTKLFGKHGRHVWELSRGIDERNVEAEETVGSVSNEHTFEEDVSDRELVRDILMHLSEKVSRRLRETGLSGRTVTLKIRLSDFRTFTRSITIGEPTNFVDDIYESCVMKLEEFATEKRKIRLVGVKVSNFNDPSWRSDLFEGDSSKNRKQEKLHKALDRIIDRFGEGAIARRGI